MTKIARFMISRAIFPSDEPSVIIEDLTNKEEEYYYEHYPTLRDISILLYQCCGQGVSWELSEELSQQTSVDKNKINKILRNIFSKYSNLSEIEAQEKHRKTCDSWFDKT